MGLHAPLTELILNEHKYKPITGDALFIGRQTVYLTESAFKGLLAKYKLTNQATGPVEFDTETRGGTHTAVKLITDRYFMQALGINNLRFLDVSDYEGADIVHDLGVPVPENLVGKFDFIYNGSCLDNMFNPAEAMFNFTKMLKPGGRIVHIEHASTFNKPYLMYSPAWFYDYHVANGFADIQVYLASFCSGDEQLFGPWDMFYTDLKFDENGPSPEAIYQNHLMLAVLAEKGQNTTWDRQPIQAQYRHDPDMLGLVAKNDAIIRRNPRPIFQKGPQEQEVGAYLTGLGFVGKGLSPLVTA